jgi:hypothetical protein
VNTAGTNKKLYNIHIYIALIMAFEKLFPPPQLEDIFKTENEAVWGFILKFYL